MTVVIVDLFCALLIVFGVVLAFRGARRSRGGAPQPSAYATRIAGVMIAAFGLALGTIVTGFSIATG